MQDEQSITGRTGTSKLSRARRWAGALVLGGILAVLAAAVVGLSISASSTPASTAREPVVLHPQGDFAHPAGFLMPEKAGPFQRVEVVQYDEAGRNVSAGYNAVVGGETPLPVVVTLYVYPASPREDLDGHFDRLLREIGEHHDGTRPEFRNNILLGPRQLVGRYAVFGYEEPWGGATEDIPLRSYLVLYQWNGWWVKWRATTPAPISRERMRAIVDLTESLLPPELDEGEEPSDREDGVERLATLDSASAGTHPPTGPCASDEQNTTLDNETVTVVLCQRWKTRPATASGSWRRSGA